jgi:glycosyltransferase involved in cell wall biosynthesis
LVSRRIVQVITRLIVGGAQLSVLQLSSALQEEGFDVRIVIGPQEGPEGSLRRDAAEIAPVTVVPSLRRELHPVLDVAAVVALGRTLRRLEPALVHTHSSKAGVVGRLAASGQESAVVHTVHGWGHTPDDSFSRRAVLVGLERTVARSTDALVAVSRDVRDSGLALGIGRPSQYRVIPEFVDYEPRDPDFARARTNARWRLGVRDEDEIVGWVGRFADQKDPKTLASALGELLRRRPRTRAVLIGDGPRREQVLQSLQAAAVDDRVMFTGLRLDARELYAAFDVLVHPSLWEGQPRVIQEALAERVPVVASRVTGTSDLVLDGRTGFLVAVRDAAAIADRAEAVLDDPRLRAPLPDEEIQRLAEIHGVSAARAGHLELYEQLLLSREPK